MVSQLDRAIARHRAALRSVERSAMADVMRAYQDMIRRLDPLIALTQQQALADAVVTPNELFRLERYQELQRQAAVELERLARLTGDTTIEAQARAVQIERTASRNMASATARGTQATAIVTRGWTHVSTAAIEELVGLTNNGPLRALLETFGETGQRVMTEQIVQGYAMGSHPSTVADAITRAFEIEQHRALTITRTEMLRASRLAAGETYRANDDILNGWYWTAAHDSGTCAACLAMDGTFHELGEEMDTHPNCRCAKRPALRELPEHPHETGDAWFSRQDADTQDGVLGSSGGSFYRSGVVALDDFVRIDDSPIWGRSIRDGGAAWALLQSGRGWMAA